MVNWISKYFSFYFIILKLFFHVPFSLGLKLIAREFNCARNKRISGNWAAATAKKRQKWKSNKKNALHNLDLHQTKNEGNSVRDKVTYCLCVWERKSYKQINRSKSVSMGLVRSCLPHTTKIYKKQKHMCTLLMKKKENPISPSD